MSDREVYIRESSKLQRALVSAFNDYIGSGMYFGPPNGKFRRILLDNEVPMRNLYDWGHALIHDDYRLGDVLLGIVKSQGVIGYQKDVKQISRARRVSDIPSPRSEFLILWGKLSNNGEGIPVGLLVNGESSEEVIGTYYREVLRDAFDSEVFNKLWESLMDYLTYNFNPSTGHQKYRDVLKTLPSKSSEKLMRLNYEGKSFPSFPGIIRTVRLAVFPNSEKFYSVPLFGEGWDENRSVLRILLKHKDNPQVVEFLRHYGIEWLEPEELKALFALREKVFPRVRKRLVQISQKRKLGGLGAIPLYVRRTGTVRTGSIRPTKVDKVTKTTYLVSLFKNKTGTPKIKNIQELLTVMMANSYYLPETIEVLQQNLGSVSGKRSKEVEEWTSVIKATFDSVILYALLRNAVRIEGLELSKGHIVFLNFLNTADRNTVVHDYYYHLLDGVEGMDLLYGTGERARVNVQNFGHDVYPYVPIGDEEALNLWEKVPSKKRNEVVPYRLYEFEDGIGGVVYLLNPSKRGKQPSTAWYVGASKLQAYENNLDKHWVWGRISQHREEYYAAMSLRNTSTAGYLLSIDGRDVATHVRVYAHGIFARSLYRAGDSTSSSNYYIRLLKTSTYGLLDGKRVRLLPERIIYRRDNPKKALDSHPRIFEDLENAVKEDGVHLVHVQSLRNVEIGETLSGLPPSAIIVDWDGLVLSKEEFDRAMGIKKHYRSWLAVLEVGGHNARVFVTKDLQENSESRIYRHPLMMLFSEGVLSDEEMLFTLGLADEKGGVSLAGTKRLFYTPYPDVSRKVIRPSLLLGGVVE
ncbi:hypothetical protein [Thermococcus thioreducens]|uniref:Uncharacterized protein n=1 Tax=Thermococcus thioreducens TaxID=277988 RepID=A0A1I0M1H9_9EURY|nr:hypothetical protein [Thermococcus thioreducens]SEV81800.1 hypothetical protein SAMN05216170_0092 [Thermococcus thioreducens]